MNYLSGRGDCRWNRVNARVFYDSTARNNNSIEITYLFLKYSGDNELESLKRSYPNLFQRVNRTRPYGLKPEVRTGRATRCYQYANWIHRPSLHGPPAGVGHCPSAIILYYVRCEMEFSSVSKRMSSDSAALCLAGGRYRQTICGNSRFSNS